MKLYQLIVKNFSNWCKFFLRWVKIDEKFNTTLKIDPKKWKRINFFKFFIRVANNCWEKFSSFSNVGTSIS